MSRLHPRPSRRPPSPQLCLAAVAATLVAFAALSGAVVVERNLTISNIVLNPTCLSPRPSVVINGQWPGPTITVSDGDVLVVRVTNLQPLPISIHWHGIDMKGAQWYDGVPGITQCSIMPNTTFTYRFRIAGQWGTFWYHSHVAQLRNTMHGALIIKPSPNSNPEPLPDLIAGDFMLMAGDWFNLSPTQLTDTIVGVPYVGYPLPNALHINGGSLCGNTVKYFRVRAGGLYRIRITNTAHWAAFNFQIANHTMVLFEAEGGYLQQVTVTSLDVYPGQSYSVLVRANQRAGNYWMVTTPRFDIEKSRLLPGVAVLSYEGVAQAAPNAPFPVGPTSTTNPTYEFVQENRIRSLYINQDLMQATVNKLLMFQLNFNDLPSKQKVYSMNNVTFTGPSMPFLLADYRGVSRNVYSSTLMPPLPPRGLSTQKGGATKQGPSVIEIPFGSWVQVVVQNHLPPGGMHPFHLHGYNFYVVGRGNGTFDPTRWNSYNYVLRNAPLRNTISLFEGQWAAFRFQAVNPGQWIFHCHNEPHADQGMIVVLKVSGPRNTNTVTSPPPADYPRC